MTRPQDYPIAGYVVRDGRGDVVRAVKMYDKPADNPVHTFEAEPVLDVETMVRLAAIVQKGRAA